MINTRAQCKYRDGVAVEAEGLEAGHVEGAVERLGVEVYNRQRAPVEQAHHLCKDTLQFKNKKDALQSKNKCFAEI